ncbi:MAG: hypothetical protein ACLQBY_06895 [Solirubrobacteraceae bacterium]
MSILRGISILPVVLLLALALVPGVAVAAEPTSGYTTTTTTTSGYGSTPNKPSTTTTSKTTPATGTLPSKEAEKPTSTTPATEPAAAKTSTTPSPKSSTLPFTGFDLRWDIGFGLLLTVAGFSIVAVQRRQRRHGGR